MFTGWLWRRGSKPGTERPTDSRPDQHSWWSGTLSWSSYETSMSFHLKYVSKSICRQKQRTWHQVIIFDVQTCPALITQGGLKQLLESEHIIKVVCIIMTITSFIVARCGKKTVAFLRDRQLCEIIVGHLLHSSPYYIACLCHFLETKGCRVVFQFLSDPSPIIVNPCH